MRLLRVICVSSGVVGLFGGPGAQPASAQTAAQVQQQIEQLRRDFDALKQQYGDRLTALEASLAALQGGQAAAAPGAPATAQVPAGAAGAGGPSGPLPVYGNAAALSKIFNPDMAVIGDFLGAAGKNEVNPSPALEMHESEAAFQAIIDPYARGDFFISFGEEGVELEEGFVTFTSLPGGLLGKVGKMRSAFGKVNGLHNHVLPWTDRPLVINNLTGGEEGIGGAGVSLAGLIPAGSLFLEATGQVYRGDSGELFHASERGDLAYVGHLRAYSDLGDSNNIDLGASYSRGHNASGIVGDVDLGRFTTDLFGFDATYRWRPLRRSIYHSFVGRTEWIKSRRDQPLGRQDATGWYASGDYQFARRWFVGGRYDRSERAEDASLLDKGGSVLLTFWPSEFSQIRGQYRRTNFAEGPVANEFLFQFQFSIGAHGAHPF
ncbi:MAG TPA: hypothetical protein VGJ39_12055 [Vicinamibacterales bacterium]